MYSAIGYTYPRYSGRGSGHITYPASLSEALDDETLEIIELWDGTPSENGMDGQCVARYRRDKNGKFYKSKPTKKRTL